MYPSIVRLLTVAIVLTLLASACGTSESTESSSGSSTSVPTPTIATTSTNQVKPDKVFNRLLSETYARLYWVENFKRLHGSMPDVIDDALRALALEDSKEVRSTLKQEARVNINEFIDYPARQFRYKVDSGSEFTYEDAAIFLKTFLYGFVYWSDDTSDGNASHGIGEFLRLVGTSGVSWYNTDEHTINREHKNLVLGDPTVYAIIDQLEVEYCRTGISAPVCKGG